MTDQNLQLFGWSIPDYVTPFNPPNYTVIPPDDGLVITVNPSGYDYSGYFWPALVALAAYLVWRA